MTELIDYIAPLKKLAKTSQAKLAKVACFIIKNGAIVSSGVNHNPMGEPMENLVEDKLISRPEVVHAEVAAIRAAKSNSVDVSGATLLLTMAPCIACARAIAETRVREVTYLYDWWDKAALDILHDHDIKTKKLEET